MSKKHTNFKVEKHTNHDTNHDRALLLGTIITVIVAIALIAWTPDVEAMGDIAYKLIY